MVQALCGDWLWDFVGVALLWLDRLPRVVYAEDAAAALPLATSSRARRPRPHLPYGTGQVPAGPDVRGLQASVTVGRQEARAVPALDAPPRPARAAALGALGPLPEQPVGHAEGMNDMQRDQGLLVLGLVESHVLGDEKGVFDFGKVVVPGRGQELDGDGLLQLPETLDPLQHGGGAAVLQHGAQHRNVLLHRGHGEVAVEDVAASLPLHRQVVPVVLYPPVAPLLDVNVGGANGDCDYVAVSITSWKQKELDLNPNFLTVKFVTRSGFPNSVQIEESLALTLNLEAVNTLNQLNARRQRRLSEK